MKNPFDYNSSDYWGWVYTKEIGDRSNEKVYFILFVFIIDN